MLSPRRLDRYLSLGLNSADNTLGMKLIIIYCCIPFLAEHKEPM